MKLFAIVALALAAALSVSCSDATLEPGAEQSQAAVTYYEAWNSFVNLPSLQTNLCHPVYVNGMGAHSQSFMLPYNVPECGGLVAIGSTTASAYPNSCVSPNSAQQGSMRMKIRCQPLSDFGPVTLGSTLYQQVWNGTGTLEAVNAGQRMLPLAPTAGTANACYLSGLGSMSVGNEYSWITYDSTYAWLNSQGFRGLSTQARCSRLGRAGGISQTLSAYPGSPAAGPAVASKTCLVTQVDGSLDDGGFELTETGGNWTLSVLGTDVSYVRADCYSR